MCWDGRAMGRDVRNIYRKRYREGYDVERYREKFGEVYEDI